MLSAGASMVDFERALRYALRAGASGFLAGRAVWWEALSRFPDQVAVAAALQREAVPYLQRLAELTCRQGRAWRPAVAGAGITREGDFAGGYGR
jgi:tagatose 1,6-diphosphate aldolase